jgi:hypothetical protein
MEFTTRLGLHSQATRLWGERPSRPATVTTGLAPSTDKQGPLQDGLGLAAVTARICLTLLPNATFPGDPLGSQDSALGSSRFARRYSGNPR